MACEHLAKEPDTLVYMVEKCRPVGSLVKLISNWFKTQSVQMVVNLDRCCLDAKGY